MKIHYALISLLIIVFLAPDFSEAAKLTLRTRGVYSNGNSESPITSVPVTAACEANEVTTGGGCDCFGLDTNFDRVNVGFQVSCSPAGDGKSFIGLCAATDPSYDQRKAGPGITVRVHCLGPLRANTAGAMATADSEKSDLILPYDQINQTDLSVEALEKIRMLERQAEVYSEKMMRHQKASQ